MFVENKGQWPEQVLYRALIPGGALFVERSAFTYVLFSDSPLRHHGHGRDSHDHADEGKAHAYRVHFEGGSARFNQGTLAQPHFENHFIGSDPAHWGTGCGVFGEVMLDDIWPGIDLRISGKDGIKYDFIVAPGTDPQQVRLRYEGHEKLVLRNGEVRVVLSTGEVVEGAPVGYMQPLLSADCVNGFAKVEYGELAPRALRYVLEGDVVSFDARNVTDSRLIIDPVLTFGSYSGSTADNFGYTATYDGSGHLYGGGIVFNVGYPLTVGVLQGFFGGGTIDVGISKWTPDGSALEWSTYLGGAGNESPHSMVVNAQDELFVFGSTGSSDFPTTPGCFDGTYNAGGGLLSWSNILGGYGFSHTNGTDIYVSHFNASATALVGSTYLGGTGTDGLNNSTLLTHNYGDHFRGEIALDAAGNPVVATSTRSTDMPTSPGAPQAANGGGQDAYLARLNPNLTNLLLGTYHGGSGDDSGLGVQFDSAGRIFVAGGTSSANLPVPGAPFDASFNNVTDGYIARYSAAGNALLSCTFTGTDNYDQCYFVQLNITDEVFVVGQTHGAYPVTPGKYTNAGSSQFVHKFSNDLGTSLWSTRIGNGSANQDLSPTAFLVSDCGQVYLSGWAGSTNSNAGNNNSTTTGSPVTSDAFQGATSGSDMHLMVLAPEATALAYATFFGGNSAEHVDGGTSRFDKNGTVYHAVCAGCGSQDDFPTTPGAWSNTNNSFNCNLGVFKFDLSPAQAIIGINGPDVICAGANAQFTNNSVGGTDYLWNFGDNSPTTTVQAPAHIYTTPGEYTVTMVLSDNSGCAPGDTAILLITVLPLPVAVVDPVVPICPGAATPLNASGGLTYSWSPATGLSATNIPDPIASPAITTLYTVTVSDACGSDSEQLTVTVIVPAYTLTPDTNICLGATITLQATGGDSYAWQADPTLSSTVIGDPVASPDTVTTYYVTITTPDGCVVSDSVSVGVYFAPPVPQLADTAICFGTSAQLVATPADYYAWQPADGIITLNVQSPIVSPTVPTTYIVYLENACGSLTDSAFVDLIYVTADAWPDTLVCPGYPVPLGASGGITYAWTPAAGLTSASIADPIATPESSTLYQVVAFDAIGCSDTAFAFVELRPWPMVDAGPDMLIEYGIVVQLTASGNGTWTWSPTAGLSDPLSMSPNVRPEETTTYTVTLTDSLGCTKTDQLTIVVTGSLYIPNTFTPDDDDINDLFGALGKEIKEIELLVFDRWGLLIWSTDQLSGRWDGTYNGERAPIDTYVWKVRAKEHSGREHEAVGHVNLLR